MKKSFLGCLMAAIMVMGCLTGCGSSKEDTSDTIRWFNASYAILTEINGWDYRIFGGAKVNAFNTELEKAVLERDWGVTDKSSADETLDWAFNKGHRYYFVQDGREFAQSGMGAVAIKDRENWLNENYIVDPDEVESCLYGFEMYEKYGENAIDAWDYSRAMNLCSFYYVAGYYTKEEALDKSLEMAKVIQTQFSSWDEFVESYLRGYVYWAGGDASQRRAVYEDLKSRKDNPYSVDFKAKLEKTW